MIPDDLGVGDAVFYRAVAQQKVTLRKQLLVEVSGLPGQYSIRYVGGGVEVRRTA